jgi:hypothetical protein
VVSVADPSCECVCLQTVKVRLQHQFLPRFRHYTRSEKPSSLKALTWQLSAAQPPNPDT